MIYQYQLRKKKIKKNYHYKKVFPIEQCLNVSKILGDHFPSKFYNLIPPPEYYCLLKTDKCWKPLHLSASVQVYYQNRVLEVKIPKCTNHGVDLSPTISPIINIGIPRKTSKPDHTDLITNE